MKYLLAFVASCFLMSGFAMIMSAVCGRYNDQCGGHLQWWQIISIALIFVTPQVIVYLSKDL